MPLNGADPARLAVVDIGSNTASLAVYAASRAGSIDRVADRSEPLRLIRRLGADGRFPAAAIDRTLDTVAGFVDVAKTHGASTIEVVATSAVRDARNGEELAQRFRSRLGLRMRVLDGPAEGVCAATSSVNTLPLDDGFVIDLGGGSLQIVEVKDRRVLRSVSLPLGALRLTDQFKTEGLPSPAQLTALRRHVLEQLRSVPWFHRSGTLVGVGGTIRAIAKTERRDRLWPIRHGHGYRLTDDAVETVWELVSRTDALRRKEIPGLSPHRVEVIVAGTLVVNWAMRVSGFAELRTSSYGVREGVALQRLFGGEEPLVPDRRRAGLLGRFPGSPDEHTRAGEVAAAAGRLFDVVAPTVDLPASLRAATVSAAHIRALPPLPSRSDPVEVLLDAPFQGHWQEDTLAIADLLCGVPRFHLDPWPHQRLRAVLDVAAGVTGELRAQVREGTVIVQGARCADDVGRRFAAAFGRALVLSSQGGATIG